MLFRFKGVGCSECPFLNVETDNYWCTLDKRTAIGSFKPMEISVDYDNWPYGCPFADGVSKVEIQAL